MLSCLYILNIVLITYRIGVVEANLDAIVHFVFYIRLHSVVLS